MYKCWQSVSHYVGFSFIEITGRMPRSGKLPLLNLLTDQKSGFSPRRGDSLHRFTSKLAGPTDTWVSFAVQNFISIGASWVGNAAPKISKNFHFLVESHRRDEPLDRFLKKFYGLLCN